MLKITIPLFAAAFPQQFSTKKIEQGSHAPPSLYTIECAIPGSYTPAPFQRLLMILVLIYRIADFILLFFI